MNKPSQKQKMVVFSSAFATGTLIFGGFILYKFIPKIPIKEYTAACLYLAVMDNAIARNELEGNTINGKKITFASKRKSLQYKYHLFLKLNTKLTQDELEVEIQKTEARLEKSKQYIGQPKQKLKLKIVKTEL